MKILVRNNTKAAWKLVESAAYKGEKELQHLLAESPALISIEDVREGAGQLVVAVHEFPLPIGYLDLLAFSAEGDMTLIECKLASNAEIKRKVIGQALEYGAHLWQMSYLELDQKIKERTRKSLAELMHEALGDTAWDEEGFRANVQAALDTGSFILMIVVDEINEELSRIVRFVNSCGRPAFSFAALEMRRFQSEQTEMLVPRVVGDTRSSDAISNAGRKHWTEESFFQLATEKLEPTVQEIIKQLYTWSKQQANEVRFGTGVASGSFTFLLEKGGKSGSIFSVYTNGTLTINFGYMDKVFAPNTIAVFRQDVSSLPAFEKSASPSATFPSVKMALAFPDFDHLARFQKLILQLKESTKN